MRQAMQGLIYDSGLVEVDPVVAADVVGDRNPDAAVAEYEEGLRMLYVVNDRVAAIASFTRAVLLNPDRIEHYNGLGRALLFKGKMAESLAAFRTALLIDPDDFDAQLGLAEAMQMGGGEYEDAIVAWQRVLALDPSYDEAHGRLAALLYYTGDYAESWEHVHQAEAMGYAVPPQFRPLLAAKMAEPTR
ncbi:MAG: tetratricopeptide repeat protein [Planctomycetes bacterium]|nr:tetratricopeptide repeat protein [Planctomycetota bacterium]